jgi:hypothetical protein
MSLSHQEALDLVNQLEQSCEEYRGWYEEASTALDTMRQRAEAAERTVRLVNYAYKLLANRGDDTTAAQLLVKALEERDAANARADEYESANTGLVDELIDAGQQLASEQAQQKELLLRLERYEASNE